MNRLTFDGNFCNIAKCSEVPGVTCDDENCTQKRVWERLKEYESIGLEPWQVRDTLTTFLKTVWEVKGTIDAAARALKKLEAEHG